MTDLLIFLAAVAIFGLVGFGIGIVYVAPRLMKHDDEEDPSDRRA